MLHGCIHSSKRRSGVLALLECDGSHVLPPGDLFRALSASRATPFSHGPLIQYTFPGHFVVRLPPQLSTSPHFN